MRSDLLPVRTLVVALSVLLVSCSQDGRSPFGPSVGILLSSECPDCEEPDANETQWINGALGYLAEHNVSGCGSQVTFAEIGIKDWETYGESKKGQHFPEAHGTSDPHIAVSKDHNAFDNDSPFGPLTDQERIELLAQTLYHERLHHDHPDWDHDDIYQEADRCTED